MTGGTGPTASTPTDGGGSGGPVASCVTGDWRSCQVTGTADAAGASAKIDGGSGILGKVAADGRTTVDFGGMQPANFTVAVGSAKLTGNFRYAGTESATVRTGGGTDATSGSWERTVAAHARTTRYRPPCADVDELQALHQRRHTATSLRRTTALTAQIAGLISLTLLKVNSFRASRLWGRTACAAATQAADPAIGAWVWAQEAWLIVLSVVEPAPRPWPSAAQQEHLN